MAINRNDVMYEEKKILAFYEAYRQSIEDFTKATGLCIELEQTVKFTEDNKEYGQFIVNKLTEIDEKYNK